MALDREKLLAAAEGNADIGDSCDVLEADCRNIIFLLENCEISLSENNRFFVEVNCDGIQACINNQRIKSFEHEKIENVLRDGEDNLAFTGYYDFGHTTTEWEDVIRLGIWGLRRRIDEFLQKNCNEDKKQRFFRETAKVYDAALLFIKRASDTAAAHGRYEMAEGLVNLTSNPPRNMFEAMQTSIIYYVLQHIVEGTYLRTLGRLDRIFYPFFDRENEREANGLIFDFLQEIDRLKAPANIPFALGGTDISGNSLVNELSYILLDNYTGANTINTKIHVLCSENTPDEFVSKALDAVRKGYNSIVFMSDEKIIESLEKIGEEHQDAVNYHVVGCYECGGYGELTSSCNARVNLPMALELALNKGKTMLTDQKIGIENNGCFDSFGSLYDEFTRQLVHMCDCAMKLTDICESRYRYIHSAPILSGVYISALEKGGDLYCDYGAKYNNSSVNAIGLATVVDSLAAIKKAVYEDGMLTLDEFAGILKSNWEDNAPLRLLIKNKFPKFGTNDKTTNELAKDIVDILSRAVSGKPNVKGGVYRLGLFSIDWRHSFGEKTAASADGRYAGETLSQNTSATFGVVRAGATAHLLSVASVDASKTPNGTIVDIDLHSSAVRGENGLKTMIATLKTYFELGGFSVHYNVLDTDVLTEAKLHPEKYSDLQVRLCGWNVLFSSLSEKEKDEFIARSII